MFAQADLFDWSRMLLFACACSLLSQVVELLPSRIRRRFSRGLTKNHTTLLKKMRKAKKDMKPTDKPIVVKTHLRDLPIVPEMVGSVVAVYNGKVFNVVEVKPEMIGRYLAEFSITYKPTLHGRPGLGATHSSRFIPLH
jgi:small subunit ribosomal protein S15e